MITIFVDFDRLAIRSLTLLIVVLIVNVGVIPSSGSSSPSRQVFRIGSNDDGIETKISAALLQGLVELETDDKVVIFVKLPGADTRGVARGRIVGALKEHKMKTQFPVIEFLMANGARIINTFWINNSILAECPVETVYRVASLEEVESIYPNTRGSVDVNSFGIVKSLHVSASVSENSHTWGLARIRAPEVWENLGITGSGVRVAVLDTGVDITHQDLAGKMWTDNALDSTYPGGWIEFDENGQVVENSTPHDLWWHGTHVSGTILGDNVSGVAIGVAPDSWLMHAAIADSNGVVTVASVLAGMEWAMRPHDQYGNPAGEAANVVNMSFGIGGQIENFREAIGNLKAAGIVPVASVGNMGVGEGTVRCPGNVYEAFGISATDNADGVWEYSSGETVNWPGSDPETYIKPDFSAPGTHVYSSMPDNTYAENEGTSMAAPHVTGTVALILQANPDLTVDNVYEILKLAADDLGDPGQDNRYGWGIIDAYDAVTYAIWKTTTQADFKACALVDVDADASPGDVVLPLNEFVVDENTLALWHFDEGSGTTVYDESPNNNNGSTILGPLWSTGKFDNALSYDNDDWVEAPNSESLNATNLTVEAWVYARSFAAGGPPDWAKVIVAKGWEHNDGFYALQVDGGKPQAVVIIDNTKHHATSQTQLELNRWYFLAMTYDGDNLAVYVDGELKNRGTGIGKELPTNDNNLTIGRQYSIYGTAQYFWDGLIDEVRIENRALSESEIASDNLAGELTVDANTMALWHFNEGSGIWAHDSSPNNNDGGLHGARWTNGRFVGGSAPDFNGINGTIWIPDSSSLSPADGLQELGVEFWYYPRSSQVAIIVGKFNYNNVQGWFVKSEPANDPNKFKFVGWVGGGLDDNSKGIAVDDAAPLNQWAHMALTYDGANIRAYVNGEERSASYFWEPHGTFGGGPIESTIDALYVGSDHGGWDWVDGVIDEVRIENRVLTPAEIAAHAEAYPQHLGLVITESNYHDTGLDSPGWGKISWSETITENTDIELYVATSENAAVDSATAALWHFDENMLSKAFDSTSNHNDGTISGATWSEGRFSRGLSFDNLDNVEVPDSSSLDISGTQLTLEAWVYPRSFPAGDPDWADTLIAKGNDGQIGFYALFINVDRQAEFQIRDNNNVKTIVKSSTVLNANTWYHIVGTYDGGKMRIYINGQPDGEENLNTPIGSNDSNLYFGMHPLSGWEYRFDGVLDETRISNVARTSGEILARYENSATYAWDNWTGPYTISSGENITSASKRYVKWKAVLSSIDGLNTPVLHDVTVNWY